MTIDQRIIDLYDEYTHAPLDRRVFLDRLAWLAGGTAAALGLVRVLECNYAQAQMVAADDPRLLVQDIEYPGAGGPVRAYLVQPKGVAKAPSLIVIHENRGLNPHIRDVARRAALEGFTVLAPDLLSPLGGTPDDEDRAREMIGRLDRTQVVANLTAARSFLAGRPDATGKVGAVGFCWGGGMSNQLAVNDPELDAAVTFYGPAPDPAQVAAIKAPLLLHYAELDDRINQGLPGFEDALKRAGVQYQLFLYPGVNHAFHNDTAGPRYNAQAAGLAWQRTVEFLKKTLA